MPYAAKTLSQRKPRVYANRGSREYDKARWKNARRAYLDKHPLCVKCLDQNTIEAAIVVDHITPHRGDMGLFWDVNNWQGMCITHHNQKTGGGL